MAPVGEPATKKARLSESGKWWECPACLRSTAACSAHAQVMLGDGAAIGLQKQLKAAKVNLKKAQKQVDSLQEALQNAKKSKKDGTVGTLIISHGGWQDDNGEGWEGGQLPLTLALGGKLSAVARRRLCVALKAVKLELNSCPDKVLEGNVNFPDDLEQLLPARVINRELRPGAVVLDPAKGKLKVYLRKSRTAGPGCKLVGMLQKEGVASLDFKHTPNKSYYRACMYCHRRCYIEIEFMKVFFEGDEKSGVGSDEEDDSEDEDGSEDDSD